MEGAKFKTNLEESSFLLVLPYGFLAMIPRSLSKGSESPSSLTAVTRNLYSLPGFNPVTSNSVSGALPGTFPTLTHLPVFVSNFSISYSLIGTPPSSSGFSHFTLADVAVISVTSNGPFGASGLPERSKTIQNVYSFLHFIYVYTMDR